jgi:hypothetical protein
MKQFITVFLILTLTVVGCKNTKDTGSEKAPKVGNKKTTFILKKIQENEANSPKTLSFRSNTEVKTADKTTTFKASVRMVTDSVIWMSITAYSYEVARIIATPDSVKYVSRTDKKYYVGGYEFIQEKIGVEFNFTDLQSMLLARSFGLDEVENIKKLNSRGNYVLSSVKKRNYKKMEKGKLEFPGDLEIWYSNWINSETYQVEKVSLVDVNTQNKASIQYLSFEKLSKYMLLSSLKMNIIAGTDSEITSVFSKFSVDQKLSFPFKISTKYEEIVE